MKALKYSFPPLLAILLGGAALADNYTDPARPTLSPITTLSNAQKRISFTPYPSGDVFDMLRTDSLGSGWSSDLSGSFSGLVWTGVGGNSNRFYALQVTPLSSNALLSATVLSKLAYGPTPDLLDRLATSGP